MNNSIQDIWNHNLEQVRAWVDAFKLVLRRKKNIKCDQMEKNDEKQEKTGKITIFRLIYSYFSSLWAWISLWLSISINSILWRPFWMVICIRKTFYRRLTIENRDRMSQIRPKSGNNGSKTKALPIFFCVAPSFHSWIFLTHNLMRLIPENIMTTGSKLRIL